MAGAPRGYVVQPRVSPELQVGAKARLARPSKIEQLPPSADAGFLRRGRWTMGQRNGSLTPADVRGLRQWREERSDLTLAEFCRLAQTQYAKAGVPLSVQMFEAVIRRNSYVWVQ